MWDGREPSAVYRKLITAYLMTAAKLLEYDTLLHACLTFDLVNGCQPPGQRLPGSHTVQMFIASARVVC
jgi:hypothetical protein